MEYLEKDSRIDWGLCLLILLFIFSPILSTQADAHPGALYVVAITIPAFIIALKKGLIKISKQSQYAHILFFFFFISTGLSNIATFRVGTFMKELVLILFYVSTCLYVIPPRQLKFALKAYLLLCIIIAILIVLSFIFGYPHIENNLSIGRYSIGITGVFKNPNYLTSFYNVSFFIIFYIWALVKQHLHQRITLFAILALFILASFLSGTRAALLVEILIIISVPIFFIKKKNIVQILSLGIIVVFLVGNYYDDIDSAISIFLGGRDALSDDSRSDAWKMALNYIQNNPLFGCGSHAWDNIVRGSSELEYLHNVFLELFLEQGLIGLVLFSGLLFSGYSRTNIMDRKFILLFLLFSAIPLCFQNGLREVNIWRFIVINRMIMNISSAYEGGICAFLENLYSKNRT